MSGALQSRSVKEIVNFDIGVTSFQLDALDLKRSFIYYVMLLGVGVSGRAYQLRGRGVTREYFCVCVCVCVCVCGVGGGRGLENW